MLEKAGFTARIGTEHLFVSVHDAVIHAVGIHSEVSLGIWMNLSFLDLTSNSHYYLLYNSNDVSSENLVLDQLIIP